MGDRPLVSVVIPVFNGERYLAEAIECVLAQLYRPLELIVLDDGSTDGTAAIAADFGDAVRYHHQPNAGLAAAQNAGAALARGTMLSYLDADDLWRPDKLGLQVAALERDAELDMVFGHVQQFRSPELVEAGSAQAAETEPGRPMPGYSTGTMLIRQSSFVRAGPFDPQWRVGEFVSWFLAATDAGLRSLMLVEVVMRRRIHRDNMGIRDRQHYADYLRIVKATLDRRRASGAGSA